MAVKVEVPYKKTFEVKRPLQETYDYFANVESAVRANFPGLEKFEKRGADTYYWEFEKVGFSGQEVQIKLATKFRFTPPSRIDVTPVQEPGTQAFTGSWSFAAKGDATHVTFDVSFALDLPIPFFLKAVAVPIAQKELAKLFDRYVNRVSTALA